MKSVNSSYRPCSKHHPWKFVGKIWQLIRQVMRKKEDLSKIWRPITSRHANTGSYSGEYHRLTWKRINELQARIQTVFGGGVLQRGLRRYFLKNCTLLFNVVNVHKKGNKKKLKRNICWITFFNISNFVFALFFFFGWGGFF